MKLKTGGKVEIDVKVKVKVKVKRKTGMKLEIDVKGVYLKTFSLSLFFLSGIRGLKLANKMPLPLHSDTIRRGEDNHQRMFFEFFQNNVAEVEKWVSPANYRINEMIVQYPILANILTIRARKAYRSGSRKWRTTLLRQHHDLPRETSLHVDGFECQPGTFRWSEKALAFKRGFGGEQDNGDSELDHGMATAFMNWMELGH